MTERAEGIKLRATRNLMGLSVKQLANKLEVDERTLRRWETGERPVPHAVKLAVAYLRSGLAGGEK